MCALGMAPASDHILIAGRSAKHLRPPRKAHRLQHVRSDWLILRAYDQPINQVVVAVYVKNI